MSSMFHIASPAEVAQAAEALPDPGYCSCTIGENHPVLLSIDCKSLSIICASCRLGIEYIDAQDGIEFVCATEIPLTMTTVIEKYSGPDGVEYDEYTELRAPAVTT